MANTEIEKMSESADKPQLSRREFLRLSSFTGAAIGGAIIGEAAPAWAKAAARGAEQGTIIEDHQRIISAELGGVKVEPLYIDAATRSGVYAILGENTDDGRVNYSGGQNAGRRVGVIEGVSPRQTVAFETLTAQAEDTGVKVVVGMRLPERTATTYPLAGAAMLIEGLDKGVDAFLGMDTPIDRAAVALRSVKSPNGVILGEHSNMDVTPEVDPKLTLGVKDLAALIQRVEGNVGYVLKVGGKEVKVAKAIVVRDELVASAEVAAPGIVIRDNMLPTPAPVKDVNINGKEVSTQILPLKEVLGGEVPVRLQLGGDACGKNLGLREKNWTGLGVKLNPEYKSPEGLDAEAALSKAVKYMKDKFLEHNPNGMVRVNKADALGVVGSTSIIDRLAPTKVDLASGVDVKLVVGGATDDLKKLPFTSSGACPVYPSTNDGYSYGIGMDGRLKANGLVSSTWMDHLRTQIGPDDIMVNMMMIRVLEDISTLRGIQFASMQGTRNTDSTEHKELMGILGNPREEKFRFLKME